MIYAVIVFNEAGLLRFHQTYNCAFTKPVYQAISSAILAKGSAKGGLFSNLLKLSEILKPGGSGGASEDHGALSSPGAFLAFRKYESIYVAFVADAAESELAILDLIQVFMETMFKAMPGFMETDFDENYLKV